MNLDGLTALLETWGCPALGVWLLLAGVGLPIPEDLLLLTAGYLVATGVFHWSCVFPLALACVVSTDFLLYGVGRYLGRRAVDGLRIRFVSQRRLERTTQWLVRKGPSLVLLARLTPGTRALVFIAAGAHGVPIGSFVRFDLIGAIIWVPAMLTAGHALGDYLGGMHELLLWFQRSAVLAIVVTSVLAAVWLRWGPKRHSSKECRAP